MARGGPASRSLVPGIAAACPFGPPALQKPVLPRHFCSPQSVDGPFHVKIFSIFSSLPCSSFSRPNRAGASNPGDGSRASLSMRRRPWPPYALLPPCEKAPLRRRSPLRPRRGHGVEVLLLRGSLPPCSPSGRKGGWYSSKTPMAAAADSRTLLRSARDLPPSASKTALPCGPRSSELPDELLTLF